MGTTIQDNLNQAFTGVGRIQAAVVDIQNRYDEIASVRILNGEELDKLRRRAFDARMLAEKMVEFLVGTERAIENRMKTQEVRDEQ